MQQSSMQFLTAVVHPFIYLFYSALFFPFASCLPSVILLPIPSLSLYLSLIIAIIFSHSLPQHPFSFPPAPPLLDLKRVPFSFNNLSFRFAFKALRSSHCLIFVNVACVSAHRRWFVFCFCFRLFLCSESERGLVIQKWWKREYEGRQIFKLNIIHP